MKKKLTLVFSVILIMLMSVSPAYADVHNHSNLYDIKSGDTLWRIANKYGTSVDDLKGSNGLQSDLILVGQKLLLGIHYGGFQEHIILQSKQLKQQTDYHQI